MYVNNADRDNQNYTTVTIRKGGKLELDMSASEMGSLLRYINYITSMRVQFYWSINIHSWEFRTEDHDIRFGILKKDTNGTQKEVIPMKRVAAHQLEEIGILTCEVPATCKCRWCI